MSLWNGQGWRCWVWDGGVGGVRVAVSRVPGWSFNYWWWSREGVRILRVTDMRWDLGNRFMAYGEET